MADPGGLGLLTVAPGLSGDHDRDANTAPVGPLPPTSNLFPAARAVRCDPANCARAVTCHKRMTHAVATSSVDGLLASQNCVSGDTDGDGICDDADDCPTTAD